MVKIAQLGLLLGLILGFTRTAEAALLVEPLVGYSFATKFDVEDGDNHSGGSGPAFGGRLGYQNFGLQLGVDYLNSNLEMDDDEFDSDFKTSEWAAFVGFKFPILFRVYGGYIFAATGETDYDNGSGFQEAELQGGTGFKYGFSFTGLPFLNVNFEFRSGTFSDNKLANAEWEKDVKYQSYLMSVSLPLEF